MASSLPPSPWSPRRFGVWGSKLCPDLARRTLALAAALAVFFFSGALSQLGVILAGAAIGWLLYRQKTAVPAGVVPRATILSHLWAAGALLLFALLLVALPAVAEATQNRDTRLFDSFYRSGSLVFGGGHVVLPLLRVEVVPPGWVGNDAFLAGYGAAQAVPGPLFTFAAYLGAVINGWSGGLLCLLAIFLPAWLLVGGALPFWDLLRRQPSTQSAMAGANAAVVGILLAAFVDPVCREGIAGPVDVLLAGGAFVLLQSGRLPSWAVVLLCAAAGHWLPAGPLFPW